MTRRRTRRARRWRPNVLDALVAAGVIGGVLYVVLTQFAGMNDNAAAMCAALATGIVFRHVLRVPSVRLTWRRR